MNRVVHHITAGILAIGMSAASPAVFSQSVIFSQQTISPPAQFDATRAEVAARQKILEAIEVQGVTLNATERDLVLNGTPEDLGGVVQDAIATVSSRASASEVGQASGSRSVVVVDAVKSIVMAVSAAPTIRTAVVSSIARVAPAALQTAGREIAASSVAAQQTNSVVRSEVMNETEIQPVLPKEIQQVLSEEIQQPWYPQDRTQPSLVQNPAEQDEQEMVQVENLPQPTETTASPS